MRKQELELKKKGLEIQRLSKELDNPPLLFKEQPNFLNQILEIESPYSPEKLLKICQGVEERVGRKERFKYGPREIDIDILWCENEIRNSKDLTLPHPSLNSRAYIKELLEEIGRSTILEQEDDKNA